MEDFENKAINIAECPPRVRKRYVDDTFVVIEADRKQGFLDHINSVDPFIYFATEDARTDGSIPFLDTIVMPQSDGSLLTLLYRKPTHTDQYLQWNSHHHLSAKFRVINTLKHRAKTVCSNQHLLQEEEDHLNKALKDASTQIGPYPGQTSIRKRRQILIKGQPTQPTKEAATKSHT